MPEMAHAGEDHRQTGRIGRRDHVGVVDRASRLDHGLGAGSHAVHEHILIPHLVRRALLMIGLIETLD